MVRPLASLLRRAELGLVLRYGNQDVPLCWVHASDLPDPTPYLDNG